MKQQILSLLPSGHPWGPLVHYMDETDSTNDRLKALARQGAHHGTTVIAGYQTAGKGRLGRSFHSPAGMGLYMSILLRLPCPPDMLMHLTCAAAVAACNAVETAAGIRPGIKWTNDLVIGSKKLGGILTELVTDKDGTCAIVGIGINCAHAPEDFPQEIASMACSLAMAGANCPAATLAAQLLCAVESVSRVLLTGKKDLMAQYENDCITVGQDVCILCSGSITHAHATGIGQEGQLLVVYPDGRHDEVCFGEVSVRGMYGYV